MTSYYESDFRHIKKLENLYLSSIDVDWGMSSDMYSGFINDEQVKKYLQKWLPNLSTNGNNVQEFKSRFTNSKHSILTRQGIVDISFQKLLLNFLKIKDITKIVFSYLPEYHCFKFCSSHIRILDLKKYIKLFTENFEDAIMSDIRYHKNNFWILVYLNNTLIYLYLTENQLQTFPKETITYYSENDLNLGKSFKYYKNVKHFNEKNCFKDYNYKKNYSIQCLELSSTPWFTPQDSYFSWSLHGFYLVYSEFYDELYMLDFNSSDTNILAKKSDLRKSPHKKQKTMEKNIRELSLEDINDIRHFEENEIFLKIKNVKVRSVFQLKTGDFIILCCQTPYPLDCSFKKESKYSFSNIFSDIRGDFCIRFRGNYISCVDELTIDSYSKVYETHDSTLFITNKTEVYQIISGCPSTDNYKEFIEKC